MNYKKALDYVAAHNRDIGKTNEEGFTITEFIIVPSNELHRECYLRQYVHGYDSTLLSAQYSNEDVQVLAVDRSFFDSAILFYDCVAK